MDFINGIAEDEKLNKLIHHIKNKQEKSVNKVLIFAVLKILLNTYTEN
jgi:hypothetical protein